MSDILIEHSYVQFTYNMYMIYKSHKKLPSQYTRRFVNKFDKACNGNYLVPSLLFFSLNSSKSLRFLISSATISHTLAAKYLKEFKA